MFAARGQDMSDSAAVPKAAVTQVRSRMWRYGGDVSINKSGSARFSPPVNVPAALFLHVCSSVGITLRLK